MYEDAGGRPLASEAAVPQAVDALVDTAQPIDAVLGDAARGDAAPADAGHREPRDANPTITRPDAMSRDGNLVGRPDATATEPTATLVLGAKPWAKVYIDGVVMKDTAPHEFKVTPGHHDVRLVFDAESPPLEKSYSIDIHAGETLSYTAVFP